jgi:hypothetical protein
MPTYSFPILQGRPLGGIDCRLRHLLRCIPWTTEFWNTARRSHTTERCS